MRKRETAKSVKAGRACRRCPSGATRRWCGAVALGTALAAAWSLSGCAEPSAGPEPTPTAQVLRREDAGDLALALDALRKLAEGDADAQPAQRTVFYLNQWISSEPARQAPWEPDRMLQTLPRALRTTPGLAPEALRRMEFSVHRPDDPEACPWLDDIAYLQQNLWLRDIALRARREPSPPELAAWLKTIEQTVGLPEAEQLAAAERLFDWTVRNIQLEPLPPVPRQPEAAPSGTTDPLPPAAQGQVGPGYSRLPLQVLLYGRGDAHERGRVFLLLCRQLGIDAVMLGILEESSPIPRPWLPAVLVGGRLYLFDATLGLPIPGPEGRGVATLEEVAAEPGLLRALDLEGGEAYPVAANDLQRVIALIDAEPAALSRRMQLLQTAMQTRKEVKEGSRLALAIQPSELADRLRKTKVLAGVNLWRAPFEAIWYQHSRYQLAQRDPQVAQEMAVQDAVFSAARPLRKARNLHLQGRFENEERKPGARALYLQCRPPDREIDALRTNAFFQAAVGLDKTLPQDPQQREAILEHYATITRQGKFAATYWLGLTYYEAGRYDVAIEWLGERTLEVSPPSPWTSGARYNLARCYEQLGKYDLARRWLQTDTDSPQRHGNLLRARWLAQRMR
jgi:tetratricopeptide (TPR) repeat protein